MIVKNAIKTPDGTVLRSRHRHDYVSHKDKISGETYMVDGGLTYIRRSINEVEAEVQDVYYHEGHSVCRLVDIWGTRGVNGDLPLSYISASEMDDGHIDAILEIKGIHESIRLILIDEKLMRNNI